MASDREIVWALLDAAADARDAAESGRALRRVRSLAAMRAAEMRSAAHEGTVARRLAAAHPVLRRAAAAALPADLTARIAACAGLPPARGEALACAGVAAGAAALGTPGTPPGRAATAAERALARRLLACTREQFLAAAAALGRAELRWMCGALDRGSAVRLLARLGGSEAIDVQGAAAAATAWDLDETCRRLAAIDLGAAGCDVAMMLGCSRLLALVGRCAPEEVAALGSRTPPSLPAARPGDDPERAAGAALKLLEAECESRS